MFEEAINILRTGGIIAYPTEAVYGLGSDPFNETAVHRLLAIKQRSVTKGLILLAHSWATISYLTLPIPKDKLSKALATWPGPTTWIFPANLNVVPAWIRGVHNSLAIRITAHPIAKSLCELFAAPIVSTSANIEGQVPARSYQEVQQIFDDKIDYIVEGKIGDLKKPTPIYDVLTGEILRN